MNVYFWIGLLLLGACAAGLFTAYTHREKLRGFLASEPVEIGTLRQLAEAAAASAGPGHFSQFVEVEGKAGPNRDGLLTSPISGTECVWHAHKVTREYEDVDYDSDGDRDVRRRSEVIDSGRSRDNIRLHGADGAAISVSPGRAWVEGARKQVSEFRRDGQAAQKTEISFGSFNLSLPSQRDGGTLGFRYEEWVVLPGTHLYVQGEAVDKPSYLRIRNPEGERELVISTRPEEERSAETKRSMLLSAGGGALAGVAGLVLTVVGLVQKFL